MHFVENIFASLHNKFYDMTKLFGIKLLTILSTDMLTCVMVAGDRVTGANVSGDPIVLNRPHHVKQG